MSAALKDRVVIVTGAGAGIGLGITREAAAADARIYGFDRDADRASVVGQAGAEFRQVDVGDTEALKNAIGEVRREAGRLDGIVNNAGLTLTPRFLELSVDDMETLWQINQRAVLVGCQEAARIMVADGKGGALVNVASNHGVASDAAYEAYAATKGAILAMGRAMAWSLGRHGIRVNTLSPGLTLTEQVAALAEDPATDALMRSWHATGAASSPEEIGRVAVFLLSEQSAAITGANIVADKGMSARLGALGQDKFGGDA